jgi:hypothetical protein
MPISFQLEEQNQHLREQNQKCNAQLELLRNHLAHSQLVAAVVKDRSSTGVSNNIMSCYGVMLVVEGSSERGFGMGFMGGSF